MHWPRGSLRPPGQARGRLPAVPVSAQCLVASPHWAALIRAQYAAGPVSAELLAAAGRPPGWSRPARAPEGAHLLAGRMALELGPAATPTSSLAAARSRRRGPAMARVSGWLSVACAAEAARDSAPPARRLPPGSRCPGRAPVDAGRVGTARAGYLSGRRTGRAGVRHAARAGRPRILPPGPSDGGPPRWPSPWYGLRPTRTGVSLAALRGVTSAGEGASPGRAARCSSGNSCVSRPRCGPGAAGPGRLVAAWPLSDRGAARRARPGPAVELVDVDGTLLVLLCGAGRVRHFLAGRTDEVTRGRFAGSHCAG